MLAPHRGQRQALPLQNQARFLNRYKLYSWQIHFSLEGADIIPLTAIGRATVRLLKFNTPQRIKTRQALIEIGQYP